MGWLVDETGLEKNRANFEPLSPLSHLRRAADIHADRTALVWKGIRRSYADYAQRVSQLASALVGRGIAPGDVVATLLPNIPQQAEAHFGVPACGAVINTINTRLDADTVGYIFGHAGAKIVLVDTALISLAEAAIKKMQGPAPQIVEVADREAGFSPTGHYLEYEELMAEGDPSFDWILPQDEWESLAINYTSGTTGRPKGVVSHHRGAYLATMANVIAWRMQLFPVYLTIVPMFHCNAWCHPWMIPMMGGTVVCCRDITAKAIYESIADEGVTHFGGAPIVLNTLINAKDEDRRSFDHVVEVFTAGAPPPAATLAAIEPLGFNVTQVYGLTETYGPSTECLWKPEWEGKTGEDRAAYKARTGVAMVALEGAEVHDTHGQPVARDAAHLGEISLRGNMVMKGYYKNPEATAEAFKGGWFRSGDIAFQHPDGYIKITDRAKDIIISGGENVSSVEVEGALMHHPAVSLCAVVAKPDEKWGEVPCAFVELKPGAEATEDELIKFCRARLAGFATPKAVVFCDLPKTSTGKIQKFELRAVAKLMAQQG
ncbi:fatty-acyl-CoA synthase [Gemmobacter aquatilis]|uniref:3-methylmercaptopropionyl-CoA ligase n=1 Tax=Gemmobacter aquatilis TaxID=933059 RepID=A0A1H8HYU3_9RHOB|nr:AMP-binding protein [Gemmobacter aquatilis]SEN61164.1 fatty-acyl-CoA synthase [Gemmobacter aquatilis]